MTFYEERNPYWKCPMVKLMDHLCGNVVVQTTVISGLSRSFLSNVVSDNQSTFSGSCLEPFHEHYRDECSGGRWRQQFFFDKHRKVSYYDSSYMLFHLSSHFSILSLYYGNDLINDRLFWDQVQLALQVRF